jgi:hypothetical protein
MKFYTLYFVICICFLQLTGCCFPKNVCVDVVCAQNKENKENKDDKIFYDISPIIK